MQEQNLSMFGKNDGITTHFKNDEQTWYLLQKINISKERKRK